MDGSLWRGLRGKHSTEVCACVAIRRSTVICRCRDDLLRESIGKNSIM